MWLLKNDVIQQNHENGVELTENKLEMFISLSLPKNTLKKHFF